MLLFILLGTVTGYLVKWLWMRELDYAGIFWILPSIKWTMFGTALIFSFLYLWLNARWAMKNGAALDQARVVTSLAGLVSAVIAVFVALGFSSQWDTWLRFRYGGAFGHADPLFGVDVGFYVFHLPFYELLQTGVMLLTVAALVSAVFVYVLFGALRTERGRQARGNWQGYVAYLGASVHPGRQLGRRAVSRSLRPGVFYPGFVYGAGYAADHVTRLALWFMVAVSVVSVVALAVNVFRPRIRRLLAGAGVYVTLYVVAVFVLPALFQRFIVQPSELVLETPYLKNYIDSTRAAYRLDAIKEIAYPAMADLTAAVIARNQDTVQNIRLWDARPLLQTYQQTQAIRLYYDFYNVAVDRYHLTDGYHQMMLATRELSPELPAKAQTWVNQYLEFTHGYGMVMNFVSKEIGGGFPQYVLQNIPSDPADGLAITQPALYYGESMPGYRIVATGTKEFDYPKGNDNVYTSYAGTGGIPVDSLLRRLLFAWNQGDINILLTTYLRPESRIQIWRTVQERVAQVAPFLRLDDDPYPVLSEGRIYWIQDAYTVSDQYPYSRPHRASFGSQCELPAQFSEGGGGHV